MIHYDAGLWHLHTIRAGEFDYYQPRQRGTVTVRYDSRIYVYRFPADPDRRAVKAALQVVFFSDGKLRGRWPEYYVD